MCEFKYFTLFQTAVRLVQDASKDPEEECGDGEEVGGVAGGPEGTSGRGRSPAGLRGRGKGRGQGPGRGARG